MGQSTPSPMDLAYLQPLLLRPDLTGHKKRTREIRGLTSNPGHGCARSCYAASVEPLPPLS